MEWNATARTWKGRWVWSPPDSVAPGDEFVLTYTVDDGHGGVISGRLGTNGKVRVGGEERIAYTAVTPAGIPEIGSVSPDGVGKRLLTPEDDALGAYFPGWQPGGNQLAYVSINEAGASALCVVNRDGTAVKVLDSDTDGAIVMGHWGFPCFPATWSPDGTRLVYCRLEGDTSSLYIVNADGSGKRRLTTPGALRSDSRPSWTREDTIVFERSRLNAAGEAQRVDVARISPSGGPLDILLTAPDVYHSFPQLSLDGSRLLFLKNLTVFSCKLDGTDERQLSSGPMLATKPVFSPNGGLIAYCGYEIISMTDNTMGVYVTTLGGLHPETGNPGAKMIWKENCDTATLMAGFLYSQEPAWSVDSSRLVFRNGSSFWGGGGLMHSRILGAPEPRKVFDTTMLDGMLCPSWAP
jgi:Tol biopolymer transport system component